jgi:hypothetical protein
MRFAPAHRIGMAYDRLEERAMAKERTDFRKAMAASGGGIAPEPLDATDPWDKLVLDEAGLLMGWTGVKARLVRSSDGTAAGADNTVYVDRAELDHFFGKFGASEKYKTAIFFALAHEFGHLCQFRCWGVDAAFAMASIEAEAHADYLAGIWLGLRLTQGHQRLSEDVFEAGIQLKANTIDYPSSYQRGRLVQDAMGQAVLLVHIIEPQIPGTENYDKLEVALSDTDVRDLFETAKSRLEELPKDDSWEKLIKRSVYGGPFRRT